MLVVEPEKIRHIIVSTAGKLVEAIMLQVPVLLRVEMQQMVPVLVEWDGSIGGTNEHMVDMEEKDL